MGFLVGKTFPTSQERVEGARSMEPLWGLLQGGVGGGGVAWRQKDED